MKRIHEPSVTADGFMRSISCVFKHSDDELRELRDYFLAQCVKSLEYEHHEIEMFRAVAKFLQDSMEWPNPLREMECLCGYENYTPPEY